MRKKREGRSIEEDRISVKIIREAKVNYPPPKGSGFPPMANERGLFMNKAVAKAYEIARKEKDFKISNLPEIDVGDIVKLSDVWDGVGGNSEAPDRKESPTYGAYSYRISDTCWINYEFDVIEEKENPLDTLVKITDINLI